MKMPCHISDGPPEPDLDWRTDAEKELDDALEDIALTVETNALKRLFDEETERNHLEQEKQWWAQQNQDDEWIEETTHET